MGFKKYKAGKIFDGYNLIEGNKVLICTEDGTIENIINGEEAGSDVHELNGIITPGLINCHCHLELSHMKGLIPEKTGLVQFLLSVVTGRHTNDEIIQYAIEKAEDEMLKNGIVATGDICNNATSIRQKAKGRMYYHNFIEATGYVPDAAIERFERSLEFFKQYAEYYSIPVESNSITPHAPYSVADPLWEMIINFPGNHLLTIHNQEAAAENEWFMNKSGDFTALYKGLNIDVSFFNPPGTTSLVSYLPWFLKNQQVILVHNVHTTANDIKAAEKAACRVFWCLCPNANLYIDNNLPDIPMLIENNCKIVLGTDSLASNKELNILDEIRTIRKHHPSIQLEELLRWGTSNGAQALQMESILGSFEKGKKPGVVLIDEALNKAERLA